MKVNYLISNLTPVTVRNSTAFRFNFREEKPDGSTIAFRGCLVGLNSQGYWVFPPRGSRGFSIIDWNEKQKDIILEALKKARILDQLEAPQVKKDLKEIAWEE